jgi:hypothetical protein
MINKYLKVIESKTIFVVHNWNCIERVFSTLEKALEFKNEEEYRNYYLIEEHIIDKVFTRLFEEKEKKFKSV